MINRTLSVLSVCVVALLAGCATPTTYHWGEYEEQVYVMYAAPDSGTAASQIEILELDIEQAGSKNQPLAPGIRAHMGFLYFQLGQYDQARQAFEAEKVAFPESAKLMDRFISKIGKNMCNLATSLCLVVALSLLSGCVTKPEAKDYTTFRKLQPKSVLVLPPLNNDVDERASYSYLSTVSEPLAEQGYYVFPVAVVDHFLKENGMPTPGEMHQIPLNKVDQIIGADAVMYIEINEYGTDYMLLYSQTTVTVVARLVDVQTGQEIWNGESSLTQSSGGGGGGIAEMLISAAISQIINSSTDAAHGVFRATNQALINNSGQGLLYGARHSMHGMDQL